ncbi:MAG: hypothetical protein HQK49_06315 [Oligoflexia bacterium]|nr:hypothetical protein [Oligoflexia bacterium]
MIKAKAKQKFESIKDQTLYKYLEDDSDKKLIDDLSSNYYLSLQELRQLMEIFIDFKMWEDNSLLPIIMLQSNNLHLSKEQLLNSIHQKYKETKESTITIKEYPNLNKNKHHLITSNIQTTKTNSGKKISGMCPVASTKTLCCNLRTIDVIQNCAFGCSYCSIQTFYNKNQIMVEDNLDEKLDAITSDLNPLKLYHFGVGQSSDSLLFGNINGTLDSLMNWALKNPNILLEFKTKSNNIDYFIKKSIPTNVFVSWTLNTETIIKNEEHLTASLDERLQAARRLLDHKMKVAFHFHPIVYYKNWKQEYQSVISRLQDNFHPSEILFISLGTITMIKPAIQEMRIKGAKGLLKSKILQMPMEKVYGRLSYPMEIKKEMFTQVYSMFNSNSNSNWTDHIFFYLCMEPRECWDFININKESIPSSNENLESELCLHIHQKMLSC